MLLLHIGLFISCQLVDVTDEMDAVRRLSFTQEVPSSAFPGHKEIVRNGVLCAVGDTGIEEIIVQNKNLDFLDSRELLVVG